MVPKGWRIKALEDIAKVRSGIAVGKKNLKDPVRLPYLRVANVQAGHLDLREIKYIDVERGQVERYSLQAGDVLMTEGGDFDKLGRGDVWTGEIAPCLHQNHVFAVRPNQAIVLPAFLAALAASQYGKSYFLSCAKKSTNLASINSSQIKQFPVFLPPLAEQQVITGILGAWDRAIATVEKLIGNSIAQKRALMHRLFSGYRSNQAAAIDWQRLSIADLAYVDAASLGKATPENFQFRYITLADVDTGAVRETLATYQLSNAPSRARRIVRPGDLLMATVRPNLQGFARVTSAHSDCIASTGFSVLAAKPGVSADYLFHYLFSTDIQDQINAIVTGSSYPAINSSDVERLYVRCPPLAEQRAIANVLDVADDTIRVETAQRDLLVRQKQALMQQLLTGKRRVRVDQPHPFDERHSVMAEE